MDIHSNDTALVITDPQNDFLSPDGVTLGLVGRSVEENRTVEHLDQLLEDGFEVHVVKDATAGPQGPELGDGYASALTNFGFIANGVVATDEAITAIRAAA